MSEQPASLQALDKLETAIRRLANAYKAEKTANDAIVPKLELMIESLDLIIPPVVETTPPESVEQNFYQGDLNATSMDT